MAAAKEKKTAAVKDGEAKAESGKKTAAKRVAAVAVPKNAGDLVIKVGKKNYTQKRLHDLALGVYQYDMGKDPKAAKTVQTIVLADSMKCRFVINGREKGEFDL